jgi:hypothetical protein
MATFTYYRQGPTVLYWGGADLTVDALLPYYEIEAESSHLYLDATLPAYLAATDFNRFSTATAEVDEKLPVYRIDAEFGQRCTLDAKLPVLEFADLRAGSHLDEKMGDMECSATMQVGYVASLDRNLPTMQVEGHFGGRAEGKLPDYEVDMSIIGDRLLSLDKIMPGWEIEAEGSTPFLLTLDKKLPVLRPTITTTFEMPLTLDASLPAFKITTDSLVGYLMALDRNLPAYKIEYDDVTGYSPDMSLDANLPTLVMTPLGTGDTVLPISLLVDATRYTDYVLRHAR